MRTSLLTTLVVCTCLVFLSSPALSAEAWGYWSCFTQHDDELVEYSTRPQLFSYKAPPKQMVDPSADFMTNILAETEWDMEDWAIFVRSQPDEEKKFRQYMQEFHGSCPDGPLGSLLSRPFDTEAEAYEDQKPTEMRKSADEAIIGMDGISSVRHEVISWPPQ